MLGSNRENVRTISDLPVVTEIQLLRRGAQGVCEPRCAEQQTRHDDLPNGTRFQ